MGSLYSLQKKQPMLTVYAPAKVNLVLEVLGRHDDYHQLSSIVQTIDLCDILNFNPDKEISLECDEPSLEYNNLVIEAANILKKSTGSSLGVKMTLLKRIPWGTGLGGGSSDAAATLLALNELWELRFSLHELAHIASRLGSDVPFFVYKGTALVEGKGEKVTPLTSLSSTWFVLLLPSLIKIPNKTKQMYNKLDSSHFTGGQFVQTALSVLTRGDPIAPALMFNVFQKPAFDFFPELDEYARTFQKAGSSTIHLAGSGPCLFSSFSEEKKANEVYSCLKEQGMECYKASSIP